MSFLENKTQLIYRIRHTERVLKNGDNISIVGNVVKNKNDELELQKIENNTFIAADKSNIEKQKKTFRVIKLLFPYFVLMYIGVNYFLFAPLEIYIKETNTFIVLAIFGMPIFGILLYAIGNQLHGFMKYFLSFWGQVCLCGSFFTILLLPKSNTT